MGTWGDESSALIESQDEINKDIVSDGTHRDENDGDVKVEVEVEANGGDVDGDGEVDECRDRVSDGVVEVGALVERLEKVELGNEGSDGSKIVEESREQEQVDYEDNGGEGNNHVYPVRPYAVDCSFYIKTGTCKFGQNCRYNHPPMGVFQPIVGTERGLQESNGLVADAGKIECKYFQTPGGCKYGDACRYNHSIRSTNRSDREYLELNFLGLPLRPSAQECTFYLRNGSCGYGANCRFNHPDPSSRKDFESGNSITNIKSMRGGISLPRTYAGEPLQSYGGLSQGTQESPNGLNVRNGSPYAAEMSSYHQTMRPNPGWNQNQVITAFPENKSPLPHQAVNNFSKRVDPTTHYENLMQIEEFPERPGQPDCDYFMKTGNCKYKSACRYNHPTSGPSKLRLPPLSSKGLFSRPGAMAPVETSGLPNLNPNNMRKNGMPSAQHHQQQLQMQNGEFPERPGQPECEYYMKTGQCKFKSACRYHHPRSRVPTPSECALSEKGLPLRPGAKLCRNYEMQGLCKYGRNCLFNHPDDHSPAAPVAAHFHSSTNAAATASLEPPAANNGNSAWDDGWGM